ncbi:Phage repressor protein C, contains Cro/C1-type HTH and peptisase s24 domains [Pseudosulfitobacter pseudonitzschiae]|nr:Phage repressor protein C, contains Cro/C1-type HTH and peptisase s24 domains [Pseudosulfitobacter pseudonitzschiae]
MNFFSLAATSRVQLFPVFSRRYRRLLPTARLVTVAGAILLIAANSSMSDTSCSLVIPGYRDKSPLHARDNHRLVTTPEVDYCPLMPTTFSDALAKALIYSGKSLRHIAESAGVSYEQLKKVKQGKTQSTNVDDAQKVASAIGLTLDQFLNADFSQTNTVSIAGQVGAGAKVPVFDAYEKGDGPQVECPPQLSPSGIVAVEVIGDSMEPVFSSGDLLFYTRDTADGVPSDAVGHRCVCEDIDGMGWVKQVRAGSEPGLFNLISLNPGAHNQHDVKLKWASRVRLHLPADLARRL